MAPGESFENCPAPLWRAVLGELLGDTPGNRARIVVNLVRNPEYQRKESHPYQHAVVCLPKDREVRVFIEIFGEFLSLGAGISRQRVHDDRIGLAVPGIDGSIEPEQPSIAVGFLLAGEPLLLCSRHIQDIHVLDTCSKLVEHFDVMAPTTKFVCYLLW